MNRPVQTKDNVIATVCRNEARIVEPKNGSQLSAVSPCWPWSYANPAVHPTGERIGSFHDGISCWIPKKLRAESDVDVLVEFAAGKKTFGNFITLSFFLEDLLQRRVELVTPEALNPYIRPRILEEVEYVPSAA